MRKLSKYEKETIINWNEGETIASIYTFNASLKRRLEDFSRKYPLLCRLERSTPEGSVTYVMDKSRLSIRLVPFPVSWTVKMKKKQKETQDILSYHTQAAGCSDKARAKASGGRQPIEECGRTGL